MISILNLIVVIAIPIQSPAMPPKNLVDLMPGIQWDTRVVAADCDCDGRDDRAYLGRYKGHVFVGFVSATGSVANLLEFAVSPSVQDAICAEPAALEMESLDYDPADAVGRIDGFIRSKTCKGLRLSGGECDPIHIFWNAKTRSLGWWRL